MDVFFPPSRAASVEMTVHFININILSHQVKSSPLEKIRMTSESQKKTKKVMVSFLDMALNSILKSLHGYTPVCQFSHFKFATILLKKKNFSLYVYNNHIKAKLQ